VSYNIGSPYPAHFFTFNRMHSPSNQLTDYDFSAEFWISAIAPAAAATPAAGNLCELFVYELANLVAGAGQAERTAHFYANRMHRQIELHPLILGLAKSSRACLPALPRILRDEGLSLPQAHDAALDALLLPLHACDRTTRAEPGGVSATRMISVLRRIATHLRVQATHAAEHALLLGSDQLHRALTHWAIAWQNYNAELRAKAIRFRVQAYVS
jgi:hypothetical protein